MHLHKTLERTKVRKWFGEGKSIWLRKCSALWLMRDLVLGNYELKKRDYKLRLFFLVPPQN